MVWNCQSCCMLFLKLLYGFLKVALCFYHPLSNKTELTFDQNLKACWSFCFESTQCLGSVVPLAMFYVVVIFHCKYAFHTLHCIMSIVLMSSVSVFSSSSQLSSSSPHVSWEKSGKVLGGQEFILLSGEDQHRTKATQLSPKTIIFRTLVFKGFQYSLFDFLTTLKKYLWRCYYFGRKA